ncbi:hypothetical protein TanjilG_23141 [Lupinus angustifolius]|uniref:Uncharacterized protein n=1 Tax=Lupinus angustifolius TaxID=3871 RepID=A0A394DC16_LUPAN|nr:PREDICTED: uncharacterized protein LOC109338830 [Lupinus angustifolius]OIW20775.1 hypothetical protein TanjilG_23141 [Lupinus angustifolius]
MAKLGMLTKLKSAIKRWPSLTKLSRNNSCVSAASTDSDKGATTTSSSNEEQQHGLHTVYVGKSRRQYLVNSDIIDHPVFQELVDKSCSDSDGVVVSCEVVLFEHLLWMLESNETQMGSMDELVEFYNCAC